MQHRRRHYVGVGDVVVTRLNVRALTTGRGWVKNGDDWVVTAHRRRRVATGDSTRWGAAARAAADYVREHVELGYASTAHRAQGRTVDTAHAYVTATTLREPLYVMATRGRESNRLYVDTAHEPDSATAHGEVERSSRSRSFRRPSPPAAPTSPPTKSAAGRRFWHIRPGARRNWFLYFTTRRLPMAASRRFAPEARVLRKAVH